MRETILQNYNAAICRDLRRAKLRRTLSAYCCDGSEVHGVIDRCLSGLEHATAAATIKAEIKSRYSHSISVKVAIELIMALLETGRE
jgi:hypothetical protein